MAPHSSTLAWRISGTVEPGTVGCYPWGRTESNKTEATYLIVILICISLITSDIKVSFHVFIGHLYIFFGEISGYIFCPFYFFLFFDTKLHELFVYFGN